MHLRLNFKDSESHQILPLFNLVICAAVYSNCNIKKCFISLFLKAFYLYNNSLLAAKSLAQYYVWCLNWLRKELASDFNSFREFYTHADSLPRAFWRCLSNTFYYIN